jgi:predicted O-methyltransferase YrrM
MRKFPWITEDSILHILDFIKNYSKPVNEIKMLEFGCGSSTIFFSNLGLDVLSIEHDEDWFNKVNLKLKGFGNYKIILNRSNNTDSDYLENPYYDLIDGLNTQFDIILVDGRDRVECFKRSEKLLVSGGIIILDNSERIEYRDIFKLYSNKKRFDFIQKKPDSDGFFYPNWTTTIFLND